MISCFLKITLKAKAVIYSLCSCSNTVEIKSLKKNKNTRKPENLTRFLQGLEAWVHLQGANPCKGTSNATILTNLKYLNEQPVLIIIFIIIK